jgi:hypothetical protein
MAEPAGITRFKVARGSVTRMRPVLGAFLGLVGLWMGVFLALIAFHAASAIAAWPAVMFALVVGLLVYMNLPGHVDVGADGLLVDLRDGQRFLGFGDLDGAGVYRESAMGKRFVGVRVVLADEDREDLKIPLGEDQFGAGDRAEQLAAMITAALCAFRERDFAEEASLLSRGGRSAEAWAAHLGAVGEGANAGPREAPVPPERLLRIAENPGAPASLRAGAAVAVRARIDAEGRARLRLAAQGTASPELQAALESAAGEDEEAVLTALDRFAG